MITVNWLTKVIHVPKAYMTEVSPTLYELDVNALRLDLKAIEASQGMDYLDTHRHNTVVVLSGVSYARTLEMINGYTVEFEDGQYAIKCQGANHNLADVKVLNQVSLIIGNSAGLIAADSVTATVDVAAIAAGVWSHIQANSATAEQNLLAAKAAAENAFAVGA